jgi:hypothetical protein
MVIGSILMIGGFGGLGYFLDHSTPYWQVAIWMAIGGIGIGFLIQNIVLAVQNTVDVKDIGASSATISFFRSLGGAVGVAILGAILADQVENKIIDGIKALGPAAAKAAGQLSGGSFNLDINALPEPIRSIVHNAYGDTFGLLFLIAAIIGIAAFIAVVIVREVPLRTTVAMQKPAEASGATSQPPAEVVAEPNVARLVDHNGNTPAPSNGHVNGQAKAQVEPQAETHTDAQAGIGESDWDPQAFDDPAERVSVAALDVLTAAQDRARAQDVLGRQKLDQLVARLDDLTRQIDATYGGFHRQLHEIREQLLAELPAHSAPAPEGSGGDELRQYEYNLLLDSQQTADRVTRLARAEAERTLAEADQQRSEIENRIEQLRGVERELAGKVSGRLRSPAGQESEDSAGA